MKTVDQLISQVMKVGTALRGGGDVEPGLIFVTGVHDAVGSRVAARLLRSGYPKIRVGRGAHKVEKPLEEMNKLGAEVADFRWDLEDSFEKSLVGVQSVFCTVPYCRGWEENFTKFLDACKKAGVKHIVKLSFYHSRVSGDVFQEVPLVKLHGDTDELLIKSGISYTILSASHFMSNFFLFQGKELRAEMKPAAMYGASHDKKVNYVSPNDTAEVAVRAILDPKPHHNKEYTLTGPEAISDQEVSQLLSRYLNKPIMYVDQPIHTFEDTLKFSGQPEWMIQDTIALEKVKASGAEESPSFITNDIEKICGHKAETYESYLNMKDFMTLMEAA